MILRNASIGEMLSEIGNRKLVVFGAGGSMRDFFQDFGEAAAEHVSVIVDNSPGERTEFIYKERRILVLSWEDFEKQVSGASCAILITVREFEEVLCQLDKVETLDRSLCYVLHAPFLWNHSRNGRRFTVHDFRRGRGKIPKIIHYCWFGPSALPELERKCVKGWERLYPDYRFMFWNEKNFDVTKVPYVRQAYEEGKYSFVSDYVRLDVLYRYGGIYLDTDVELLGRLDPLMVYDAFFAFEHWNLIATGLGCGCTPLHPVIKDLRSLYHRICFRNTDGSLNLTSCPEYHTEYFRKRGVEIENRTQEVGGILFLSSDYLSPINQGNGMLELNENSMGIHKYSCSWLPKEQKRAWEELKAKRASWNERLEKDWKKKMMNVEFVEAFRKNFEPYKEKRIVLYGLGENTKLLLDSLHDFQIVALMDRQEAGTVKWGKRVISVKELETFSAQIVVIVARDCFIKLIYGRIAVYCRQHDIQVFEVRGRRLNYHDDLKCGPYVCNALGKDFTIRNDYEMGYQILGPIMARFMLFIIKEVQNAPESCVLFGARDGYIFEKMYRFYSDFYKKERSCPKGKYVYTSRASCVAASLTSEEDILYAMRLPFSGTIEDMLVQRFFVEEEEVLPREKGITDVQYILLHKDRIVRSGMRQMEYYKRYLSREILLQKELFFVDFWASGTCQLYLEKLLGHKLLGVYLRQMRTGDPQKEGLEIVSMYPVEVDEKDLYYLDEVYILLEGIVTSPEPTVKCFGRDGSPIFFEEKRTQKELVLIQRIQQGILDYFKDYITGDADQDLGDLHEPDSLLGLLYNSELVHSIYLQDYVVEDEFANRKFNVNEFI